VAIVENEQDMAPLWKKFKQEKNEESRNAIRNEIVEHYLNLVGYVANRLAISLPPHIDRDDLFSSGYFGLMNAVERFEPGRGNKFETYAGIRIRGAMLDYLRSRDFLPSSIRQQIRQYEKTLSSLEDKLGRSATDDEIAKAMGKSSKEMNTLLAHMSAATVIPLEEYIRTENAQQSLPGPEMSLERNELKKILAEAVGKLQEKERAVVAYYYFHEMTMREISEIMHISEARVCQLHTKAIFRLRGYLARAKATLVD